MSFGPPTGETEKKINISPEPLGRDCTVPPPKSAPPRFLIKKRLGPYGSLWFVNEWTCGWIKRIVGFLKKVRSLPGGRVWADRLSLWILRKPLPCIEALPHLYTIEKGIPAITSLSTPT